MKSVLILATSSFVMILGSSALQAHHSAAQFDFSKPVTSDGGFIVWFKTRHGLEVGFRGVSPTTNSSGW